MLSAQYRSSSSAAQRTMDLPTGYLSVPPSYYLSGATVNYYEPTSGQVFIPRYANFPRAGAIVGRRSSERHSD